jgi:adenylate cyclase, class 2
VSVEQGNDAVMTHSPARNVELKARDRHRARSLAICTDIGAEPQGVLRQRDTYFEARHRRLKLREEEGGRGQLIAYERSDQVEERESRYRIVEVDGAEELKAALSSTLGVRAVVAKERLLFLWEGVRIHLDRVDGLGDFIEFEAVADTGSDLSHEEAQVVSLRRAFAIDAADLVAGSYCDMVPPGAG